VAAWLTMAALAIRMKIPVPMMVTVEMNVDIGVMRFSFFPVLRLLRLKATTMEPQITQIDADS